MLSKDSAENRLGVELSRYRRRPAKDIQRDLGLTQFSNTLLARSGSWASCLTVPVIVLAECLGSRREVLKDPFWGWIVIGWFVACLALLLVMMQVWPRRVYLAIHEEGFVYRSLTRRYTVRFDEIAQCIVTPNSRGVTVVGRDSKRLWFRNFLVLFPQDTVSQLMEHISRYSIGEKVRVTEGGADLKARIRRTGLFAGLVIYSMLVIGPVTSADSREVTRKACGETVFGMPCLVFAPLLLALVCAPFIYVVQQLTALMSLRLSRPATTELYDAKDVRKALIVVVAGGVYFFVLGGIWIAYTAWLGI